MGHDRTDDGGMLPVSFDGSVTVEVRNLPGRKTVAFCGTRGVPANYGGFETTVDEISRRFAENGYDPVVYCRKSSCADKALKYHQGRSYEPKAHDATDRRMNWVGYKVHLITECCDEGFAEPHHRRSNERG